MRVGEGSVKPQGGSQSQPRLPQAPLILGTGKDGLFPSPMASRHRQ